MDDRSNLLDGGNVMDNGNKLMDHRTKLMDDRNKLINSRNNLTNNRGNLLGDRSNLLDERNDLSPCSYVTTLRLLLFFCIAPSIHPVLRFYAYRNMSPYSYVTTLRSLLFLYSPLHPSYFEVLCLQEQLLFYFKNFCYNGCRDNLSPCSYVTTLRGLMPIGTTPLLFQEFLPQWMVGMTYLLVRISPRRGFPCFFCIAPSIHPIFRVSAKVDGSWYNRNASPYSASLPETTVMQPPPSILFRVSAKMDNSTAGTHRPVQDPYRNYNCIASTIHPISECMRQPIQERLSSYHYTVVSPVSPVQPPPSSFKDFCRNGWCQ